MPVKRKSAGLLSLLAVAGIYGTPSFAAVEWSIQKKLQLPARPLDVAVSLNDKWIFVLGDRGEVLIFSKDGLLKDKIRVGKHVDQIRVGPAENILYLGSRRSKTVEILALDFIQEIDTAGSPSKGPADAPVVIAVFTDFECPYCARLVPLLDQVLGQYPRDVKLVYKSFPLANHRFSSKAAMGALAAESQGKFWEFHDLLFKDFNQLNDQKLAEIAKILGLDEGEFNRKMQDPQIVQRIGKDYQDGIGAGVTGTPTLFVNGKLVRNRSLEGFRELIDGQLHKLRRKTVQRDRTSP